MKFMGLNLSPDRRVGGAILFAVFAASCATQEISREAESVSSPMENLVEVQPAYRQESPQAKPGVPLELTLSQPELEPKKAPDSGPRFSLSAEDVDVKTILYALSKEIGQNITIDPVVSKKVTVHLKEVTLREMLDNVLLPLHLRYQIAKDFIQVIPAEMQTRVFHLNYLISRRQGFGSMQVSRAAETESTAAVSAYTAKDRAPASAWQGDSSLILSSEETDLWQEISSGLQQIVAGGGGESGDLSSTRKPAGESNALNTLSAARAYFSINQQAGVIVVNAYPEVLLSVAEFLEEVEGSVQRQVFIQARIIEVSLKDEYPAGIDWSLIPVSEDQEQGAAMSPGYLYGVEDERLEKILKALARQGEIVSLSSPKIAALNNQRALIKVGREDAFFVPEVSRSAASTTEIAYIPSPVTLGIVLDVVPQINVNGDIMMSVHASVSRHAGERRSPDGVTRIPVLDVREANNVVLARNGQTVVIGGLLGARKEPRTEPANVLETIPVIGGLFHQDLTRIEKSELVILLTPEVMVGAAIDDRWRIEEKRLQRFKLPRQTYKMQTPSEGK